MALKLSSLVTLAEGIFAGNITFTKAGALTIAGAFVAGSLALSGALSGVTDLTATGTVQCEDANVNDLLTVEDISLSKNLVAIGSGNFTGPVTSATTIQAEQFTGTDDGWIYDRFDAGGIYAQASTNVEESNAASFVLSDNNITIDDPASREVTAATSDGYGAAFMPGRFHTDPCPSLHPSALFWNIISGYLCYCDQAGDDLKVVDDSACY